MRDISAGRDIIDSNFIEILGNNPSIEIMQQPAKELAEAEKYSRTVVRGARKSRAIKSLISIVIAIAALVVAVTIGYTWLLQGGEIGVADLVRDGSNVALGALLSVVFSLLIGCLGGAYAYSQKDPTQAERINFQRLQNISTRWDELKYLGFPKSEIRKLRRRS